MKDEREDAWGPGKLYEPYVGRWSRLVAKEFLAWLQVEAQKDWLDVGCGTGALSEERRAALRDRIRADLPVAQDGSIDLIARAWAVRGQAPA